MEVSETIYIRHDIIKTALNIAQSNALYSGRVFSVEEVIANAETIEKWVFSN